MASLFELVNRLGVLAVGRRPRWSIQTDGEGAPDGASAGVSILGSVQTLIHVALREEAHRKTTRIETTATITGSANYRVNVDGIDVFYADPNDDPDNILAGLRDTINAVAPVSAIVTASVEAGQLVIRGVAEADYTIAVSDDETNDQLAIVREDASEAKARVWVRPAGSVDRPDAWTALEGELFDDIDRRGLLRRLSTAGYRRCYVEIFDEDGDLTVSVGPAVEE